MIGLMMIKGPQIEAYGRSATERSLRPRHQAADQLADCTVGGEPGATSL